MDDSNYLGVNHFVKWRVAIELILVTALVVLGYFSIGFGIDILLLFILLLLLGMIVYFIIVLGWGIVR